MPNQAGINYIVTTNNKLLAVCTPEASHMYQGMNVWAKAPFDITFHYHDLPSTVQFCSPQASSG